MSSPYTYNPVDIANLAASNMRALGMNVYAPGAAGGLNSLSGNTIGMSDYLSARNATGRNSFNRQLAAGDLGALQLAQGTAAISYPGRQGAEYEGAVRNWTQVYGLGMNSPFVARHFNGSAIDLGMGIQSMLGAGAKINGRQTYGGGPYTDAVALDLYNNVQKSFFNGPVGLGNQRAFGFDKTEFGQMFSSLGQRGAFSGLIDSTVTTGADGAAVTHGAGSLEKLNSKMAEAARSLGLLKDIFGATKNIAQLINIAENVGGVDFADPKAFQNLQARVVRSTTRAMSMGMDPRATLEYEAALSETFRGMGYSTSGAGALGGITMDAAQRRYGAYREARLTSPNVYLPNLDQAAFVGVQADLQNRMIAHPESHAALVALDLMQSGSVSGSTATALRRAMSDTSDTGISNLRNMLGGMGYNINNMVNERGGAQAMFSNLSLSSATAFGTYSDAVLGRRSSSDLIASILRTSSYGALPESQRDAAGEMVMQMKSTLTSGNQVKIAEALRGGAGRDTIMSILAGDESNMSAAARTTMANSLMGLGSEFGNFFNQFNSVYARSGGSANSTGDRNRSASAQLQALRAYENMDARGKPLHQLIAGALGSQTMSQDAIMAYMSAHSPGDVMRISDLGAVTDADLAKLLDPEQAAEFRTRIDKFKADPSSDSRDAILNDLLSLNQQRGGISGRSTTPGEYLLASSNSADTVRRSGVAQMLLDYESTVAITPEDESEEERKARGAAIRSFADRYKEAPDPVKDPAGYAAYMEERKSLTGSSAFSKAVVASALSGGSDNAARLKDAFSYNKSLTQTALQEEIDKKREEMSSAKEGKKNELRQEIQKLEDAKAAGANEYLGILKLKIDDNFLVELSKSVIGGSK